jgi:hypothetical protein
VERGLLALSVEPAGAGGQQAERPAHRLRPRRLPGGRGVESTQRRVKHTDGGVRSIKKVGWEWINSRRLLSYL